MILNSISLVLSYIEQVLSSEDVYFLSTPLQMVMWNSVMVSASSSKPLIYISFFYFYERGIRMG